MKGRKGQGVTVRRSRSIVRIASVLLIVFLAYQSLAITQVDKTDVRSCSFDKNLSATTRYSRTFTENFADLDHIDTGNTSCSVNTAEGRAYLWASTPIIPPTYIGTKSINTRSHGGGFSPKYNEYWYPEWSGSTIYRYDMNRNYLGAFGSGQHQMMQVWGDTDGTYYTANWGYDRVYKWSDRGSSQQWSYHVGGTAGGVCCDEQYVYALRHGDSKIFVLDKTNGNHIRNINLPSSTSMNGGMAYANGIIYLGGNHGWGGGSSSYRVVNMIKATDGTYIGSFQVGDHIYSSAFNGEEYWTSPNSNTVWCYKLCEGNAYAGSSENAPVDESHVQSKVINSPSENIGAVKLSVTDHQPPGTNIIYRMTLDGEHWEVVQKNENHAFEHPGSSVQWNATFRTNDRAVKPYIDNLVIEYDLTSAPEPYSPDESEWLSDHTPTFKWNYTDPDDEDEQYAFLIELYDGRNMDQKIYSTGWVDSANRHFAPNDALDDGLYYWRVQTKDSYQGKSNFSVLRRLMIDITDPEGNLTIEKGASSVNDRDVELYIEAWDDGSGVAEMQITDDFGVIGPWMTFQERENIALYPTDGEKTIRIRLRDHAGLTSAVIEDSVYLDLNGPGEITVSSTTHPDGDEYYGSSKPVFEWEPPEEISGIKGYSYTVDQLPVTIPNTMIYEQDPDLTGTEPGEFSGLSNGMWFFHIAACDIFDQWSGVSHFKFNIDAIGPGFSSLAPDSTRWHNATFVDISCIIEDQGGSGLDTNLIRHSYKTPENPHYSSWSTGGIEIEILKKDGNDNPTRVKASTALILPEGINNVKWGASDRAGNGPVESGELLVRVDNTEPVLEDPLPKKDKVFQDTTIQCGITVDDGLGSGMDPSTVQYCISTVGDDEDHFIDWISVNIDPGDMDGEVRVDISFQPGNENYIKWRVKDLAGNGFSYSKAQNVMVNSPPVPKITSPLGSDEIRSGKKFTLSGRGTTDINGDLLTYYWAITDKTTNTVAYSTSGMEKEASLDRGSYTIRLYVNDGNSNVSVDEDILVMDTGGGTEDGSGKAGAFFSNWWWLILILFVMVQVVMMVVMAKRYRGKRDDDDSPKPITSGGQTSHLGGSPWSAPHPYPDGRHFPEMDQRYGGVNQGDQYPQLGGNTAGAQSGQLSLPPGPSAPIGGGTKWGTAPETRNAQGYPQQPAGPTFPDPMAQRFGQSQHDPRSAQPVGPMYSLPSFPTEQGTQRFDRMALPPANLDNVPATPAAAPQAVSPHPTVLSVGMNQSVVPQPTPTPPVQTAMPSSSIPAGPAPRIVDAEYSEPAMQQPQTQNAYGEYLAPQTGGGGDLDTIFGNEPQNPGGEQVQGLPGFPQIQPKMPEGQQLSPRIVEPNVPTPQPVVQNTYAPQAPQPAQPAPLTIQCHACGSTNAVTTTERPTIIVCSNCGQQGMIG